MSATHIIKCPNPLCGFHFPVNLKKHLYRRERFCPRCHTEITVRPRFKFLPNPNWFHQKAEQAYQRTRIKEMRRQEPKQEPKQPFAIPTRIPESLLALSILFRQREMELEEEQRQKREKSNS